MTNTKTIVASLTFALLFLLAVFYAPVSNAADNALPATSTAPASRPRRLASGIAPLFNVVAFYNATYDAAHINFVHEANIWFPQQGEKFGFTYTATNNWKNLNKEYLADFQVVMFLDNSPSDPRQRAAFQEYMDSGGGWMGFHVCAFTTKPKEWDWYFNTFLASGSFRDNTWFPTAITYKVEDPSHPAMKGLGSTFASAKSEWYSWSKDLSKNPEIDVLASVDPSSFPVGTDPNQSWHKGHYPIIWSNRKYRMIYTNFGHNSMDYKANVGKSSTFDSPDQDKFIINSILWLGSRDPLPSTLPAPK